MKRSRRFSPALHAWYTWPSGRCATSARRAASGCFTCLIERAVAGTLDTFLQEAETLVVTRLGRITVADLAARVPGLAVSSHYQPGSPHAV